MLNIIFVQCLYKVNLFQKVSKCYYFNLVAFRYNGLIRKKTVGVEEGPDGKGVVLVTKRSKSMFNNY